MSCFGRPVPGISIVMLCLKIASHPELLGRPASFTTP
jgi:hypothetical protein